MNQEELSAFVKRKAEKISETAARNFSTFSEVGFAVRIPTDAGPEARLYVDQELRNLRWKFTRILICSREYYVLFPLG